MLALGDLQSQSGDNNEPTVRVIVVLGNEAVRLQPVPRLGTSLADASVVTVARNGILLCLPSRKVSSVFLAGGAEFLGQHLQDPRCEISKGQSEQGLRVRNGIAEVGH